MQRQAVCAWADWLNGVTAPAGQSVNALLAAMPASQRDPLDSAALVPVALVADPYRVDGVTDFGQDPPKLPAIYVVPDGPEGAEGEVGPTDRKGPSIAVNARVILRDASKAKSQRYADYVMRAIEQSTAFFLSESNEATDARSREGVRITLANRIQSGGWSEDVGQVKAVAVVAIDFQCRDQRPKG